MAHAFKLGSTEHIVGHTLEQLLESKYALPLLAHDQQVMSTKQEQTFEEVFLDANGKQVVYLCRKAPLINTRQQVIGLIAVGIDITHREAPCAALSSRQQVGQFFLQKLVKEEGGDRYYLPQPFSNCYLTQRELDCVLHLLEGKSAKQIGRDLHLSFRTVEFYFHKIKTKLNCHSRFELANKINALAIPS